MMTTSYPHLSLLLFAAMTSGCATPKYWTPTGGSRSDGIVELSFQYGLFEDPQIQLAHGTELAAQRCQSWGYTYAEPFGGTSQQCTGRDINGSCIAWTVTGRFQCTTSHGQPSRRSASRRAHR